MTTQNESTVYISTTYNTDGEWPILSSVALYLDPASSTLSTSPTPIVVNSVQDVANLLAQCDDARRREWAHLNTTPAHWERIR